jgi:hypothetical protein
MDPVDQASAETQPQEVNVVSIDDLARIRRWLSTHHGPHTQDMAALGEGAAQTLTWTSRLDGEGSERRG